MKPICLPVKLPFLLLCFQQTHTEKACQKDNNGSEDNGQVSMKRACIFAHKTILKEDRRQAHPDDNDNATDHSQNGVNIPRLL